MIIYLPTHVIGILPLKHVSLLFCFIFLCYAIYQSTVVCVPVYVCVEIELELLKKMK